MNGEPTIKEPRGAVWFHRFIALIAGGRNNDAEPNDDDNHDADALYSCQTMLELAR